MAGVDRPGRGEGSNRDSEGARQGSDFLRSPTGMAKGLSFSHLASEQVELPSRVSLQSLSFRLSLISLPSPRTPRREATVIHFMSLG